MSDMDLLTLPRVDVTFEKADKIYMTGEVVTGYVRVEMIEADDICLLYAELRGHGMTNWKVGPIRCRGFEEYVDDRLVLIPSGDQEYRRLDVGFHLVRFCFLLPKNLPSSFQNRLGHISYRVMFGLDNRRSLLCRFSEGIQVINCVSAKECSMQPVQLNFQKNLFHYCWEIGHIKCYMEFPCNTIVLGDTIPINLLIRNHSNQRILQTSVTLTKKTEFMTTIPIDAHRAQKIMICEDNKNDIILPGELKSYRMELLVPEISVDNFSISSLFTVSYKVNLIIHITGCHFNMNRSVRVKIAHES